MFFKMLLHNGHKTLVNLSLVQRIVLADNMIAFIYHTPHISGTFLNNRHYENYYFESSKKADEIFVEIQNEINDSQSSQNSQSSQSSQNSQSKEKTANLLKDIEYIIELEKGRSSDMR